MKYVESGEDYSHSVAYTYDLMNNLTGVVETINGTEFTSSYGYNDDNVLTSVTNGSNSWTFGYDDYGRLNAINGGGFNRTYNYKSVSNTQLTAQLSSVAYATLPAEQTYAYTYDDNGNITSVTYGGYTCSYVYDSQNQLIRENNSRLGRTYTWTYDNAGNILSRSTYAYTTGELGTAMGVANYRYEDPDWGDKLTGINGNAITYDEIGNMLTFGGRTFTWEHGRQLASQTVNGSTWTYDYNLNDGMRTGRTNGSISYEYVYNGSQLTQMTRNGVVVDFTYINGIPATISFNGNTFYYVVNGQGDVTAITDSQGNILITYYYDAWGSPYCTYNSATSPYAQSLYDLNPFRYRGYVYDWEVGLYYLQSRYYIPDVARFLNADGLVSTGQGILGNNMFTYCKNNPVCRSDPSGYLSFFATTAAFATGFAIGIIGSAVEAWEAASDLLGTWLFGDGSPQLYLEGSLIVEALQDSPKMDAHVQAAVHKYESDGLALSLGEDEFLPGEDGWDLYLSIQHFSYSIAVTTETRDFRVLFWDFKVERTVANVFVNDTYNFDPKAWEGIGNVLNNVAYYLNSYGGTGNDYDWCALYSCNGAWRFCK